MSRDSSPHQPNARRWPRVSLFRSISSKRAADRLRYIAPSMANAFAPALIVVTPLITFLTYHRYELWRPESLVSIALFLLAGFALSGLIAIRPQLLRPAIIGLLLVLFLDMQFRPKFGDWVLFMSRWHFTEQSQANILMAAVGALTFTSLILTWVIRRHLGIIVSTIFGTMILSTVILPGESIAIGEIHSDDAAQRADLPTVAHLILDEQIGPAGLPMNIPGAADLRRDMEAFYVRNGFTLFPRAYSQYSSTVESVSNTLNGTASMRSGRFIADTAGRLPKTSIKFKENEWFQMLAQRGYRIRVYQTDYIDYCSPHLNAIEYCLTVPSNSIHSLIHADLSTRKKISLILSTYLADISSVRVFKRLISPLGAKYAFVRSAADWLSRHPRLGAIAAQSVMDKIADDLRANKPGTAIFAHLLTPHGAFVYNADCTLRPELDTWLSSWDLSPPSPTNTPTGRIARYLLYFNQVRCTQRKLAKIFDAMRANGQFARSTIIIHGDHGSRIAEHALTDITMDDVSRTDLVDLFSTLFAVHGPDLAIGQPDRQESLQRLFAEVVMKRSTENMPADVYSVPYAVDSLGKRLGHKPMPRLGN